MTGKDLTKIIDARLEELHMSQKDFCAELGISSAAMSAWRKGSMPKTERLKDIEKCLGISFADYEKSYMDDETADILQSIRERQDLRILLHSAKDVPVSSIYALISQIEKMKEDEN